MIIPELTLSKLLIGLIKQVKLDFEANVADETKSLLYQYFNGLVDHKKDYYVQAKDLFTREPDHARNIEVRLFFDASRAAVPTIHITMPSEQQGQNSLGLGESGYDTIDVDGERTTAYERRFDTQYHIVCTSDNHSEVLLMYHLVRAGLISVFDTLSLTGLENARISGQELKLNADLVPNHIFMRAVGVDCSYDVSVPRWWTETLITAICTEPITLLNP